MARSDAYVGSDTDESVRAFIALSLQLWGVDARVNSEQPPGILSISSPNDIGIILRRAAPGDPFRWYLERVENDISGSTVGSVRPCGSIIGVLNGLRRMLGIAGGSAVRIARDWP